MTDAKKTRLIQGLIAYNTPAKVNIVITDKASQATMYNADTTEETTNSVVYLF